MGKSKARTALEELDQDGSFKRKEAAYRNWISTGTTLNFELAMTGHPRTKLSLDSPFSNCKKKQRKELSILPKRIATICLWPRLVLGPIAP